MGLIHVSLAVLSLSCGLSAHFQDDQAEEAELYGPEGKYEYAHTLLDHILGESEDRRRKRHFVGASYEKRRIKLKKETLEADESGLYWSPRSFSRGNFDRLMPNVKHSVIASPKHPHRLIKLTEKERKKLNASKTKSKSKSKWKSKRLPKQRRSPKLVSPVLTSYKKERGPSQSEESMFTDILKKILKQRNDLDENDMAKIFQDRNYGGEAIELDLRRLFKIDRRRNTHINDLDNLPEAEPLRPGDTLIRPNKKMLKSASHYPKENPHLVYGNADNLGIRNDVDERVELELLRPFKTDRRRHTYKNELDNLPEAEPLKPGDTLIRPNKKMLKSASHYPKDDPHLVYGNANNLGIRYGNKPFRNKYSSFRKRNDLTKILQDRNDVDEGVELDLLRLFKTDRRRHTYKNDLDNLPEAEPLRPGDTLIRPNKKMLKSASHYPKDDPHLVYGNANNLGIRYGNKPFRTKYSSFRKTVLDESDLRKYLEYYALRNNISIEPDYLPEVEPMKPGDTLIRPSKIMLKSASHYPKDDPHLVYGNANNLGIRYGNKPFRNKYSSFRKTNEREETEDDDMISLGSPGNGRVTYPKDTEPHNHRRKGVEFLRLNEAKKKIRDYSPRENRRSNLLSDIVADNVHEKEDGTIKEPLHREFLNYVARRQQEEDELLKDDCAPEPEAETEENDRSAEKNPGNPYTIFKNKYKQNWLWNHEMTGDHMNINPYGPSFNTLGPTGAELFFGRKWWYFNQDDYIPFRRR